LIHGRVEDELRFSILLRNRQVGLEMNAAKLGAVARNAEAKRNIIAPVHEKCEGENDEQNAEKEFLNSRREVILALRPIPRLSATRRRLTGSLRQQRFLPGERPKTFWEWAESPAIGAKAKRSKAATVT
jgi:hypothetical protein